MTKFEIESAVVTDGTKVEMSLKHPVSQEYLDYVVLAINESMAAAEKRFGRPNKRH
jgi:hypothetical protein